MANTSNWLRGSLSALAMLAMIVPCRADCSRLAGMWLTLTPTANGEYLVPVTVAGKPLQLKFEFGSAFAVLDNKVAMALALPTKPVPRGMGVERSGAKMEEVATAPTIGVGQITRKDAEFLVAPASETDLVGADGAAGMNIFGGFDVELDLGHNKLGLFLPGHCPFVPYWKYDVMGSTQFMVTGTGTILLPMKIDGVNIQASLDTRETTSHMQMKAGEFLFGIRGNDPKLVPHGDAFRYPFKTLVTDDITINDPDIEISRNPSKLCGGIAGGTLSYRDNGSACIGSADVSLGLNLLRRLRFFFDYHEKRVYFTRSELSVSQGEAGQ